MYRLSLRRSISLSAAVVSMASCCAYAATDVPNVREWISSKPTARSIAADHRQGMGYLPTPESGFRSFGSFKIRAAQRSDRPDSVLLTEYLPPIGNQGQQGSCVGWSTAYNCYSYSVAKQRKLTPEQRMDPKFQFSPSFIYHLGEPVSNTSGMYIYVAFTTLQKKGCATLAEMPYDEKDWTTPPSEEASARAERYKARSIGALFRNQGKADVEALKTYLADCRLPFVTAIPIFKDFPGGSVAPDYVYNLSVPPTKENFNGGHAITVVGYDDSKQAFRIVNSWGENWGDKGFLWISEEFMKSYAIEAWAQMPGGIVARSTRVRLIEPEAR